MGRGPIFLTSAQRNFGSLRLIQLRGQAVRQPVPLPIQATAEDTFLDTIITKIRLTGVMAQKTMDGAVCDAPKTITTPLTGQSAISVNFTDPA
jgi:hypothetical protein